MANLAIQFDQPSYQPGDLVSGNVIIDTDKSTNCDELALAIFWRTHGRGDRRNGEKTHILLAQDETWTAGGRYKYPFEFQLPDSPVTYAGKYLNITWTAELEAKFDGKSLGSRIRSIFGADLRESFTVATTDGKVLVADDLSQDEVRSRDTGLGILFSLLFVGLFVGVGLIFVLVGLTSRSLFFSAVGLIPVVVGFGAFLFFLRRILFSRYIQHVELLNVRHDPVSGDLRCDIEIVPKRNVQIASASATLTVRERTVNSSGTTDSTYHHTIHEDRWERVGSHTISSLSTLTLEPIFHVPDGLPPSFSAYNNDIEWYIDTHIKLNWLLANRFQLQLHTTAAGQEKSPSDQWDDAWEKGWEKDDWAEDDSADDSQWSSF